MKITTNRCNLTAEQLKLADANEFIHQHREVRRHLKRQHSKSQRKKYTQSKKVLIHLFKDSHHLLMRDSCGVYLRGIVGYGGVGIESLHNVLHCGLRLRRLQALDGVHEGLQRLDDLEAHPLVQTRASSNIQTEEGTKREEVNLNTSGVVEKWFRSLPVDEESEGAEANLFDATLLVIPRTHRVQIQRPKTCKNNINMQAFKKVPFKCKRVFSLPRWIGVEKELIC